MGNSDPSIEALMATHPLIFKGALPLVPSSVPPGWVDLTSQLFSSLTATLSREEMSFVRVLQVKEKFGSLRIRLDLSDLAYARQEIVRQMVDLAEQESLKVCRTCGAYLIASVLVNRSVALDWWRNAADVATKERCELLCKCTSACQCVSDFGGKAADLGGV